MNFHDLANSSEVKKVLQRLVYASGVLVECFYIVFATFRKNKNFSSKKNLCFFWSQDSKNSGQVEIIGFSCFFKIFRTVKCMEIRFGNVLNKILVKPNTSFTPWEFIGTKKTTPESSTEAH